MCEYIITEDFKMNKCIYDDNSDLWASFMKTKIDKFTL